MAKFEEEVDDVVPLAVREISLEPGGWVENYSKEDLRIVHSGKSYYWQIQPLNIFGGFATVKV